MKLRNESGKQFLVYYERPPFEDGKEVTADVQVHEVVDPKLGSFLSRVLGVQAVVEKQREVWRFENIVFNLDDVKGVGKVFEIELQQNEEVSDADRKMFTRYMSKFKPFLGKVISGSNADSVKGR